MSLEFIFSMPRDGMRAGGIWPAIIGTVYLTLGTAIFSIPLGIMAAIYLNEYAAKNWFTRTIELAIINLAGVPSIVYGLFGLGLFVTFLGFGASILAGSLTLAIMTLPVHYHRDPGSAERRSPIVPGGFLFTWGFPLADGPSCRAAERDPRDLDRRDPGPFPGGGGDRADPFHGRRFLSAAFAAVGL